jgi:hypothetical protein
MGLWRKFLKFFSKNRSAIPQDKIKRSDKIPPYSEIFALNDDEIRESQKKIEIEKFRGKQEILTEIPKEEIEIIEKEILQQRLINAHRQKPEDEGINQNILIKKDTLQISESFPKKCEHCSEGKNYSEGEIFQCRDCDKWFCGRHYQGHILKKHGSRDYRVQSNENGQGNYKFYK